MANRHTITDLYQMQSLSLDDKVQMTKRRIDDWVNQFGEDGVYVSFSGGKDSTVLAHIVRVVCGYRNFHYFQKKHRNAFLIVEDTFQYLQKKRKMGKVLFRLPIE